MRQKPVRATRTVLAVAGFAVVALGSTVASAQTSIDHGIEVSAALGVARSTGNWIENDHAISYYVPALVPLTLGLGYRFSQAFYAGLLFGYDFGFTDNCPSGASCSADRTELGIEGRGYLPSTPLWGSVGVGYESLEIGMSGTSGSIDGYEYLSLKVGGEFEISPRLTIAPYFGFELGRYGSISAGGASRDIPDNQMAVHTWIIGAVRFAYTVAIL